MFDYQAYLTYYVDSLRPQVVSYDHYPFFQDGTIRSDYFYNLSIIRAKAGKKPFWACPMTVGHFTYIDPQEAHLNFMYFCPIAYGSKGLLAFSYWPLPYDGYRSSLFDQQGNKTQIYDIVRRLNLFISRILGPVVMRLPSVEVYNTSIFPPNQTGLDEFKSLMPSAIHSVTDPRILIGVFKDTKDFYLLVVNKDLVPHREIGVTLRSTARFVFLSPSVIGFGEESSSNYQKIMTTVQSSAKLSTFVIPELAGGEGRLVRVGR
jgi:hypothetical protein